jgi:hypothetical protein
MSFAAAHDPELALLRHADGLRECLFIGAERKWAAHGLNGANDLDRTSLKKRAVLEHAVF